MNDFAPVVGVLISLVVLLLLYIWLAVALSAVFRKAGASPWKGWVPIVNTVTLLQLGGFSGWLVLLGLIPIFGAILLPVTIIVACYQINRSFGLGAGMTVLAAFLLPVWATVLGFGSARWLGTDNTASPVQAGTVPDYYGAEPRPSLVLPPILTEPPPDQRAEEYPDPVRNGPTVSSWFGSSIVPPTEPEQSDTPDNADTADIKLLFGDVVSSRDDEAHDIPVAPVPQTAPAPAATPEPAASEPEPEAPEPAAVVPEREAPVMSAPDWWSPLPEAQREPEPEPDPIDDIARTTGGSIISEVPSAPTTASERFSDGLDEDDLDGDDLDEPNVIVPSPAVTRPPAPEPAGALWARRTPAAPADEPESDSFPEASGEVSAVVGVPDAGAPRSALSSVSALYAKSAPDEDESFDETIIARRRRVLWRLVPPKGAPIDLTADTVIVGRRPGADPAHPGAQLVAISDDTRTVSKTHALLVRRSDTWFITDLGSTNGVTFATLMGTDIDIDPGVETEAGDRFFLGDAEVQLARSEG
ncbi:hypothetical protein FHX48_002000 [Microbacterium halimionae]|uniref:FHA domain-containing protein n=1 Tax=Microbacterium halimionae TaxID=1526413 RepID=A0A7W3JQ03_9MICO|nr:DUF5684 domain-containing protein [Microbacterium halimionae]MBA8816907.1 hypothetical protein [Microbacterium halimionae]NII94797.1 hypothetical protein [Microbacterium halimionae]